MRACLFATALALSHLRATFLKVDGKDPFCKTGLMEASTESERVCCPAFCSECSDYASCEAAFEHAIDKSKNACCSNVIKDNSCASAGENGLSATSTPKCTASCAESLPPCIMTDSDFVFDPNQVTAADDCGNAVGEWQAAAAATKEAITGLLQHERDEPVPVGKCTRQNSKKECVCQLLGGVNGTVSGLLHLGA